MIVRRLLGLVIIITALLGVGLSVAGIVLGHEALDRVGDRLDAGLDATSSTLDNLEQTLELSKDIVDQVVASMVTLEQAALDASKAIDDTRPMITDVSGLVTGDVADGLESVQETLAPVVDVAETVDDALRALSQFKIEQEILGVPIKIDPGIEYDPDVSLPRAVNGISDSLEGIPEKLRAMSGGVKAADENLEVIGEDLVLISGDIGEIRSSLAELPELIDGFQEDVINARAQVQDIQADLKDSWQLIKTGLIVFFVWLGLTQIAPLIWGVEMLRGRRMVAQDNRAAEPGTMDTDPAGVVVVQDQAADTEPAGDAFVQVVPAETQPEETVSAEDAPEDETNPNDE